MLAHYLPQMYLKRFTHNERVWVYDWIKAVKRSGKLRGVGAITDFYILKDGSGRLDDTVETQILAKLEGEASPLIDALVEGSQVSASERQALATFFALLCVRTPSFADAHGDMNQELARITFRRLAGTVEKATAFLARRKKSLPFDPVKFSRFVNSDELTIPPNQNERIQLMIEMSMPAATAFQRMKWRILRTAGETCFVTSDAPMGFLPQEGALPTYGELSPHVLKVVALSPSVCLELSNADDVSETLHIAEATVAEAEVKTINRAIAGAATRLVIGREEAHVDLAIALVGQRDASSAPRTCLVEWYDSVRNGSFTMSVRVHFDTRFPLRLPLPWRCRRCGNITVVPFFVSSDLTPQYPNQYSAWLDRPCAMCGQSPRQSGSSFSGEDPLSLVPPEDQD